MKKMDYSDKKITIILILFGGEVNGSRHMVENILGSGLGAVVLEAMVEMARMMMRVADQQRQA
jgi:hypothetical protein